MDGYPLHGAWEVLKKATKAAMTDLATHPILFRHLVYWIFRYSYLNGIEALNRQVKIELSPKLKFEFPEAYARRLRPARRASCAGNCRISINSSISGYQSHGDTTPGSARSTAFVGLHSSPTDRTDTCTTQFKRPIARR